jgi:tetratricopeptide (TPR) repeat protein
VAVNPSRVSVWLLIALIYLSHYHDFQAAVLACNNALQYEPTCRPALYLRAESYARRGYEDKALKDYGRLIAYDPTDPFPFLYRGRLLLKQKEAKKSLFDFMAFTNALPATGKSIANIHARRGKAFRILGQ